MDFDYSAKTKDLQARLLKFMDDHIYPSEKAYADELAANTAAAELNVQAHTRASQALDKEVLSLQQQLAAFKLMEATEKTGDKARQEQIKELEKKIELRQADAEKARQQAQLNQLLQERRTAAPAPKRPPCADRRARCARPFR